MAEAPARPRIRRRRIVERRRLEHALDRSRARTRSLVAGAGYGKTVLLEQWASRDGRRVAWYRARSSAVDVAVVARALQAATSSIVPGAGRRMLERLSVTEDPEREAVLLAEMLAEDLSDWPDDAWLLLDDYQHLAAAEGPERFVEVIATRTPLQLLLASRERPIWVDGKAILYGDVLEITQAMLAMTTEEAAEVLEGGRLDLSSGLLTLAEGWPAVIGLAGMAPDVTEIEVDADVPETLYAFFSEEVYRGLDPDLAAALALLAALPAIDREIADLVLGPERASRTCFDALSLGILDERDDHLELHPLAAAFHARNARTEGVPGIEIAVGPALNAYRGRGDWDAAIRLVAQHGDASTLPVLLEDALRELLDDSRLTSLEKCTAIVAERFPSAPIVGLAQAELAFRQGLNQRAQTLAESVESQVSAGNLKFRAALLAGAGAHAGSRELVALEAFARASVLASTDEERREADWGELMAATALELPEAPELLDRLIRTRVGSRPIDLVREADKKLALGLRFGAVTTLDESKRGAQLLGDVGNPVVRASFLATLSCALNLAADYDAALVYADLLLSDASDLRMDFALPYAALMRGSALAGLRRFDESHEALALAFDEARRLNDQFGQQGVYAARVRVLLQQGRSVEACAAEPPDVSEALPGMRGEVIGSRALALACLGRLDEANELASDAGATRGIEAAALVNCVKAVVAVRRRDDELYRALGSMVRAAYRTGAVDMVVTTYRSSTDVLAALLRGKETAEITGYIVARARDEALAADVGIGVSDALDPVLRLSKREREIYELVCQGIGTTKIARSLFISEATVKLHIHHIFDKIGVRSRTALVLFEANRRKGQATSSAGAGTEMDGPSSNSEATGG